MFTRPDPSLGVAGIVGLVALWAIPIGLIAARVFLTARRLWRRWSTPLPVIVPPLHVQRNHAFPRCLPDPSPRPNHHRQHQEQPSR